ncbi:hypothetical protein EBU94_08880, partial [bacterium]|nr:hypothetical protein [bacterium]
MGRNYAAAISTNGLGTVKSWNPGPNNQVVAIQALPVALGGDIYLGGYFTTVKGAGRNYFARVNNSNGNLTSFNPNPNGIVSS